MSQYLSIIASEKIPYKMISKIKVIAQILFCVSAILNYASAGWCGIVSTLMKISIIENEKGM